MGLGRAMLRSMLFCLEHCLKALARAVLLQRRCRGGVGVYKGVQRRCREARRGNGVQRGCRWVHMGLQRGCRGIQMGAGRCLSDGGGQAEELLHMRVTAACENDFDAAQRACRGREGGCPIRPVESTVVGGGQARSQLGRRVMQG